MVKDVSIVKKKLRERIATSGEYYEQGYSSPEKHPLEQALKKLDKMKARIDEAFREGRVEAGMKKALEEGEWEKAKDKAVRRWTESADEIADNYEKAYVDIVAPCVDECKKKIEDMPDVTLDQRLEKAKAFQKCMNECAKRKKGVTGRR